MPSVDVVKESGVKSLGSRVESQRHSLREY